MNTQAKTSGAYWRIWATLILGSLLLIAQWAWSSYEGQIGGGLTAAQLNDDIQTVATAKAVSSVPSIMNWLFVAAMVFVWLPFIRRALSSAKAGNAAALAMALCSALILSACGPAKVMDPIEIKPNETTWVIPLEGETKEKQQKFDSVEFLEGKKVASKRVMMDKVKRSTGRMWWDYEWIAASKVIKVDRSLVSREWTNVAGPGEKGKGKKEGILVVTKDSIRLVVGLAVTVSIEEVEASKYLYYHGERPLAEVVDSNIRNYAVAKLTSEYSKLALSAAQEAGPKIFDDLFKAAKEEFAKVGITVHFLGNSEGVEYENLAIQEAINKVFIAEQDQKTALQEKTAQVTRNEMQVAKAQAQADAAQKLFTAQEATRLQNELEVLLNQSKAALAMAEKWNGQLPASILPSNSPLLLNLGAQPTPPVTKRSDATQEPAAVSQ